MSENSENAAERVCAVVVTYNRPALLGDCLAALLSQSHPPSAIFVIDNDSADATRAVIERYLGRRPGALEDQVISDRQGRPVRFRYWNLGKNSGGAGGFSAGVQAAMAAGYDWLWLLDDDVEALPHALATQLSFAGISRCINAGRAYADGEKMVFDNAIDVRTGRFVEGVRTSFSQGRQYEELNFGCFEGMLIHRSIVDLIGPPDPRFFTAGDDTVYGLLASQHTRTIYIQPTTLLRKIKRPSEHTYRGKPIVRPSDMAMYYDIRNEFLKNEYLRVFFASSRALLSGYTHLKVVKVLLATLLIDRSWKRFRLAVHAYASGLAGYLRGAWSVKQPGPSGIGGGS